MALVTASSPAQRLPLLLGWPGSSSCLESWWPQQEGGDGL